MAHNKFISEVVAARGKEIYQQKIRDKVEPEHKGKFLSNDNWKSRNFRCYRKW